MIAGASNIQSKKTSPGGNDTQIQYNNSGAFAGAGLEYTEPYANAYGLKAPDQPTIDNDGNHLAFQATGANGIGDGGYVGFEAGNADTNGDGGYTYMGGGQGGSIGGNGGNAQLYGGNAIAGDGDGGRVEITGGSADGVGTGGDVKIIPGSSPSGTPGVIRLGNPGGTFFANLDTSGISAERAITLQDGDGTLAFLSDIPPPGGGATINEIEVDFGTTPVTSKKFTITNASITTISNIMVTPSGKTATGRVGNDAEWESYSLSARPGIGNFELSVVSNGHVKGPRKFLYTYS